ncbi:hypothetical protein P3X46_002791 [Hevea brasiliensis]|uniref:PPIase cyclophilin-type domain-containing protein n=1 Tax=Hevea brasiliensis TaxID=3981 RepID=A0ABQ9N4W2_HEVBR|nr:peptidyl-prolyl cis-trans isomerase CYP26-2, chloroplastic [Hevea brasiliensis]KAJ9187323.1 hypothetical protein P3X46_002791 [Hevea brasiliensis]
MLQNPKLLQIQSSLKLHSLIPPTHFQSIPTCPIIKQCCKLSRRELAIFSNSSLLLLLSSQSLEPFNLSKAKAEENLPGTSKIDQPEEKTGTNPNCSNQTPTKQAFLDISVDGEPVGRIIIGLYGEGVPAGAARFSNLVSGAAGISYRRKEFIKIMPNYVQHGGVRSYGVDAELASRKGSNLAVESLADEWERQSECSGIKNSAGTVSIIVRDPLKPPPKLKLIARNGKLEIDKEKVGTDPNGTEFVIATGDSPDLDDSILVIGRVLEGMEVVERIGRVKTVQENTGSPYFRVAKLIGDKRAVVAERGFNRPYSKVIVTNCGLME